jgi:hypothetical protein
MSRKLKLIRGCATAGLIVLLWCVIPLGWSLDVQRPVTGWTEAYRSAELVVFTKDVEKGRRIVAIAEVDARPEVVFNVVNDFDHYPEFMPYVIESRVLSRNGDSEVVAYNRIAPPFVAERDYPLKFRMTRGSLANGGVFRSEWTASPEAEPEVEGVVRIRLNDGSWVAEPISGGSRTRLTYTLLTNPGGLIPDFVANMSNTVAIPKLFKAVMKRSVEKAGVEK